METTFRKKDLTVAMQDEIKTGEARRGELLREMLTQARPESPFLDRIDWPRILGFTSTEVRKEYRLVSRMDGELLLVEARRRLGLWRMAA